MLDDTGESKLFIMTYSSFERDSQSIKSIWGNFVQLVIQKSSFKSQLSNFFTQLKKLYFRFEYLCKIEATYSKIL